MPAPQKETSTAQTLLSRAHSPDTASRIYTEKVLHRPLHLKPSGPSPPNAQVQRRLSRQQKLSQRKKLKPAPLSSRQKRSLCLYDIPRSAQRFSVYKPLHHMWLGYIREILGIDEQGNGLDGREVQIGADMAARLVTADYHGALVEVVRSRCVGRIGVGGIVVKDSKFGFEVVTKANSVKLIPKEHTVFRFKIPRPGKCDELALEGAEEVRDARQKAEDESETKEQGEKKAPEDDRRDLIFELHGDQFIYRAADRANRKFKMHFLPDL